MKTATPHRFAAVVTDPASGETFRLRYVRRACAERIAAGFSDAGCLAHVEELAPAALPALPGKPPYDATPTHACSAPSLRHQTAADALRWATEQAGAHKVGYAVWRLEAGRWAKVAVVL